MFSEKQMNYIGFSKKELPKLSKEKMNLLNQKFSEALEAYVKFSDEWYLAAKTFRDNFYQHRKSWMRKLEQITSEENK